MTNKIANRRIVKAFACSESTRGTAVFPTAAAEAIECAGVPIPTQQPTFSDSEEISETLDVTGFFRDQTGSGTVTINTYIHPSGTVGSVPMCGPLFKSLMGVETINSGTSVVYSQATTKPSVTVWIKLDHTVYRLSGAVVVKATPEITNSGGATLNFDLEFMEMRWAGTDAVNGEVVTSQSVIVDNAKKFKAGMYLKFGTDDNTGAGYQISSVDVDTDTLTMEDSVSISDGTIVYPFLPDFTPIGTALPARKGVVEIDSTSFTVKKVSLDIGSPVQMQTDEITPDDFPSDYIEDVREITGSIEKNMRQNDAQDFYNGYTDSTSYIDLIYGDTAGSIMTISLPYSKLEVPTINDSAPTVSVTTNFKARGSSGEDSCTITFT